MEPNNLSSALAKAQAEMSAAPKNGYNPHFKNSFSTLEDLIEVSRKPLTKYGLSVTQYPHSVEGETFLVTKLRHASGEDETSVVRIHLKDPTDIQKLGSAMSYLKRYAYAAICGIATSEGDDDGNSNGALSHPSPQNHSSEVKSDTISAKQLAFLRVKIGNRAGKEQEICKHYGIVTLDKLPWRKMQEVVNILEAGTAKQEDIMEEIF